MWHGIIKLNLFSIPVNVVCTTVQYHIIITILHIFLICMRATRPFHLNSIILGGSFSFPSYFVSVLCSLIRYGATSALFKFRDESRAHRSLMNQKVFPGLRFLWNIKIVPRCSSATSPALLLTVRPTQISPGGVLPGRHFTWGKKRSAWAYTQRARSLAKSGGLCRNEWMRQSWLLQDSQAAWSQTVQIKVKINSTFCYRKMRQFCRNWHMLIWGSC
jgi:hypothetical protein